MQCTNRCPLYPRKRTNLPPHLVDDPSSALGVNLTKPHVFGLGPFQVTYQIIVGSIRANHSGEFANVTIVFVCWTSPYRIPIAIQNFSDPRPPFPRCVLVCRHLLLSPLPQLRSASNRSPFLRSNHLSFRWSFLHPIAGRAAGSSRIQFTLRNWAKRAEHVYFET